MPKKLIEKKSVKEIEVLTPRQKEVLLQRAAGQTKELCADKLRCTPDNVGDHNKEIHRKMKANNGIKALGMAVATGQITPEELHFLYTTSGDL